ncbi:MAG: phosphopantothenoylcysteine decarboxylase [Steroidobacteraceae bacterium]
MNVLVTSGPTREPIDSVRFISNLSSGRTGVEICEALTARGFSVTQVRGVDSAVAKGAARREAFSDHTSLDAILRRLLADSDYGVVIHAAAVGDFSVAESAPEAKLVSGQELVLKLRPTPKLIDRIRGYASNPDLVLIGFKLTHDPDPEAQARAARELLQRSHARYVVQNDVATLANEAHHVFVIHESGSRRPRRCIGRARLAATLVTLLEESSGRSKR